MNREGIEKLEAKVDSLQHMLLPRAYASYLFIRPMYKNTNLKARIKTEGKGASFKKLLYVLYRDLILELVKICDDKDLKTLSVRRIIDQIKNKETKQILEDKYSRSSIQPLEGEDIEVSKTLQANEEIILRKEFRVTFKKLMKNADKLFNSGLLAKYKDVRNRLIAHYEFKKTEEGYTLFDLTPLNLKYGQERELLELLKTIVDDLNSVVRRSCFMWDSFYKPEIRDVCKFWGIDVIEPDSGLNADNAQ